MKTSSNGMEMGASAVIGFGALFLSDRRPEKRNVGQWISFKVTTARHQANICFFFLLYDNAVSRRFRSKDITRIDGLYPIGRIAFEYRTTYENYLVDPIESVYIPFDISLVARVNTRYPCR